MAQRMQLTVTMSENQFDQRLDQTLAEMPPDYSRLWVKGWILNQRVLVNGKAYDESKEKVLGDKQVVINAEVEEEARFEPQGIPLDIIYGDEDIIIINRPRDLMVHPDAGNPDGTVLNTLLHYYPPTADIPRTGIVHRLDKDTTSPIVVAKTVPVQTRLVEPLQRREITRGYRVVVISHMTAGGTMDEPISRHPTKRTHMMAYPMGKPAVTHYRIMEHFCVHARLRLRLETGRTRQVRVHIAHTTRLLVGDPVYGSHPCPPKGVPEAFISTSRRFNCQALHATMLYLYHPISSIKMEWHAPIPQGMVELIEVVRADFEEHKDGADWL